MPYIPKERRMAIDYNSTVPKTAGELNYYATTAILRGTLKDVFDFQVMIDAWIKEVGLSYQTINDMAGVALNVPAEFMRRGHYDAYKTRLHNLATAYGLFYSSVVARYENDKVRDNGDVF